MESPRSSQAEGRRRDLSRKKTPIELGNIIDMLYTDLNKAIDVGSSAHLIEFGPFKALVDCGMHPKKLGFDALPDLSKIPDDSLDFIAITHAHLDHCGALPVLIRRQNSARVLVSEDSRELMFKMLRNSRSVMVRQRQEKDIKEYPLFDNSHLDKIAQQLTPMAFNRERVFELNGSRVSITFTPSGHIPGAASITFEYNKKKYMFSGDISFHDTNLLKGAKPTDDTVDILVVETTRGAREKRVFEDHPSEEERLIGEIARVIEDGGNVLIPAFALGRMQEVLLIIAKAKERKAIPAQTPVFIGGLAVDIAEHLIKLSKTSAYVNFSKKTLESAHVLREKMEPGKDFDEKGIYVLGSGMMVENTPAYVAASCVMGSSANAIFLVGYCDPETPAAKLLKTHTGDDFAFRDLFYIGQVNCRVDKFDLTSHADREEILDFILRKDPRCVVLTHGSEESRQWFMYEILDRLPNTNVVIPEPLSTIEL